MPNPETRISHEDATVAALKRDPKFAIEYLNAVLADGNRKEVFFPSAGWPMARRATALRGNTIAANWP